MTQDLLKDALPTELPRRGKYERSDNSPWHFAFAEGSVEEGKFPQLVLAEVILAFGHVDAFFDDLLDSLHGLADGLEVGGRDVGVQRFVLAR